MTPRRTSPHAAQVRAELPTYDNSVTRIETRYSQKQQQTLWTIWDAWIAKWDPNGHERADALDRLSRAENPDEALLEFYRAVYP